MFTFHSFLHSFLAQPSIFMFQNDPKLVSFPYILTQTFGAATQVRILNDSYNASANIFLYFLCSFKCECCKMSCVLISANKTAKFELNFQCFHCFKLKTVMLSSILK